MTNHVSELQTRLDAMSFPEPFSGCILWTGSVSKGYGQISIKGRLYRAHRVSFECRNGPIPPKLYLDHLCRTPLCINPAHLEPVTHQENLARGARLITHCPHGHEYSPANTKVYPSGRTCIACSRINALSRYRRLRDRNPK